MSAFARHPRRTDYEAATLNMAPKNAFEIMQATVQHLRGEKVRVPPARYLSPQNRRVRFAVDTDAARAKDFPNPGSRQQRRRIARTGQQIVTHGPEEVAD